MALDYGEVRIGIAFSDLLNIIASPFETYTRVEKTKDLEYLSNLIKTQEVDEVIMGLPLNMDGSEGERALATREFARQLEEITHIKITFVDERLTSVEADEILASRGIKWEERKKYIDKLSATIILQDYLNSKK